MADLSNYLSALRNALQLGGVNPLPGALVERLYNSFSGPGSVTPAAASERPAPPGTAAAPAAAPAAAAPASAVRPMAAAPAPAPEPMPPAPEPAAAGQPQSLLDRLRQSTAASLENPGLQSAGDIGAGMLASRSPNFFTMLGAGLQAQRTGERERMQELRQAASAEAEARYRDQTIRLKEEQLRDPSARNLREAQAEYYRRRPDMIATTAGARGRLTDAQYATIVNQAEQEARRQHPDPTPGMPDTPAAKESRRVAREEFKNRRIQEIMLANEQRQSGVPVPPAQPAQAPPSSAIPVPLTGPLPPPAPAVR